MTKNACKAKWMMGVECSSDQRGRWKKGAIEEFAQKQ